MGGCSSSTTVTKKCGRGLVFHGDHFHFHFPLQAKVMFDGESASLDAILKTNTVRVPKPVKVFGNCH